MRHDSPSHYSDGCRSGIQVKKNTVVLAHHSHKEMKPQTDTMTFDPLLKYRIW